MCCCSMILVAFIYCAEYSTYPRVMDKLTGVHDAASETLAAPLVLLGQIYADSAFVPNSQGKALTSYENEV